MRSVARSALATVLATLTAWTATLSWRELALDAGVWIRPSLVVLAVVLVTGVALRSLRVGAFVTFVVQALLGMGFVCWHLTGGPIPVGGRAVLLADQVRHAFDLSTRVKPPAPVEDGVLPLLLAGSLLAILLVDLVAVGLRSPALAGALLLGIWSVTFWDGPVSLPWWAVVAPAAGYCLLLLQHHLAALSRWGHGFALPFLITGAGVGAVGIAAAVAVPHLVPVGDVRLFDGGQGSGGTGQLKVTNPMVSLRRELVQGPDNDLMTVRTDDPAPAYLRLAVLTTFRDDQWTPGDRTVPETNGPADELPPLTGVGGSVPRTSYHYDITATGDFDSRWLPTAAPITSLAADGDWRYDTSTMDFLASDKSLSTLRQRWAMTGVKLDLSSELLGTLSPESLVGVRYLELPDDLPSSVTDLAKQVTATAQTPFAKAVALQRWFRSEGGFVYDTSTRLGDGSNDLVTFLSEGPDGRRGFCQQFAAAMTTMARSLDIPARVAVGFLRPDKVGDDTWVYSAHDLHAWPELYFQGAGWVRFEPTPAVRASGVPDYTRDVDEGAPLPTPSAVPTPSQSARPNGPASPRPREESQRTASADGSSHVMALVVAGGGGAVVLLLLAPSVVRRVRRRRRLSRAGAEDLWAELRDTATDLGAVWPEEGSVRQQAAVVRVHGPASDALGRLVTVLEEARYAARPAAAAGEAGGQDLEEVNRALWESAGPRARRRARILPPSLFG